MNLHTFCIESMGFKVNNPSLIREQVCFYKKLMGVLKGTPR